ncbi:MAG TPA: isoprenylcysteine carboxylmethyltransferase family protein [Sphingomicrobium sp.]|nr:isoprenylcysteine carboxylmethyltransferase family protein [Sphingomicrobium sp.]
MNPYAIAILAFVTAERLFELWLARRNTLALLAHGAREHGAGHYPLIVGLHFLWLLSLWAIAPWRGIDLFWLAFFGLLQLARLWVLTTLGQRWTTRIIVSPGQPLVESGLYRFLNHPNYWVVIGEIAVLPLVFGLPWVAVAFSILNAAVLWVRIREENRALGR